MAFLILINYNFQNIEVLVQNVATQVEKAFYAKKKPPNKFKVFLTIPK